MTKVLKVVDIEDFSDRMAQWRAASGLSMAGCASSCGITRGYWHRIETVPDLSISEDVYVRILELIAPPES